MNGGADFDSALGLKLRMLLGVQFHSFHFQHHIIHGRRRISIIFMMEGLKIEVRLRSVSKASRNDPRQTPSPEYYLRLANEGILNDIKDPSSDNMSSESNLSEDYPFPECEWPEQIDGIVIHQDDGNPDAGWLLRW